MKSLWVRIACHKLELEENYIMVMAELEAEDNSLDDGAMEIDNDEVYGE